MVDPQQPRVGSASAGDGPASVTAVVRALLAALPDGCSWLLPVTDSAGEVTDFVVEAVSDREPDLYGRGAARVGARLSALYPNMVGGALWQLYRRVLATGVPGELPDFRYAEQRAGVVAESEFSVSVHGVLGGLLVAWQRVDESRRRLERTEVLGNLGWTEFDVVTGRSVWSPGMYRIFARDPALGPLSRAEQSAAVLPADTGLGETAWQTLDSGAVSDVTVRFRVGEATKTLRILSEAARDAEGNQLKIYAVVQDVTSRENSRAAIDRLRHELHNQEMTALAEHRLAGQLQNLIQPVPREPFSLSGLEAVASYVPAESVARVGGDWYHADTLADGTVVMAVGDVAGHGLEAASGMAHLRFALIGWLSLGIQDPGTLLGHLNRLCLQLRITGTAVIATFDPSAGTLSWARAGHMPPLLSRSGVTRPLDRPRGLLLGAVADAAYPVEQPHVRANDLILFYTDGLVERRTVARDVMLGQVIRILDTACTDVRPEALVWLRAQLHSASPDDDTCTLAVRVTA